MKIIVIVIIVVILAAAVYAAFSKRKSGIASPPVAAPTDEKMTVGREFLLSLLSLKEIKLNDLILSNPAFRSLKDFTITLIPEGNEGRRNPFAPLGQDAVAVSPLPENGEEINPESLDLN